MTRDQLEHAIRAACDIAHDEHVVVIGSQAILGQFPDAPAALTVSTEVDLYPRTHPERADQIDGAIGEQSLFHEQHGFYVHGVGPETAVLPTGWERRLVPVRNANTRHLTGWCLEVHDLAVSKLVPFREKDVAFVEALLQVRYVTREALADRMQSLPLDPAQRALILARLEGLVAAAARTVPRVGPADSTPNEQTPRDSTTDLGA